MMSLLEASNRCLAQFLHIYKTEACLWQTKSTDYHNKRKRDESYAKLAVKLREMDPAAGIESVQRKINSLRSNFRRELKKVKAARKQGQTYVPQLWYYKHLEFLKPEMLRQPPSGNDPDAAQQPTQSGECDADALSSLWGGWPPTTVVSPPSPEPTRIKREASLDIADAPEVTTSYNGGSKRARNDYSDDERRARHEANDYSDEDPSRHGYSDEERRSEYSEGGSRDSRGDDGDDRREEDQFDLFGRLVVMKMRALPREQRIIAEKLINDALFLAEMGDLTTQHTIVKGPSPNPQ